MAEMLADCTNILIEQTCGTCIGGFTSAVLTWIPHLTETICEPIFKASADILNAWMGK